PGSTLSLAGFTVTASVRCFGGTGRFKRPTAYAGRSGRSAFGLPSSPSRADLPTRSTCTYTFGTYASVIGTFTVVVRPSIVNASLFTTPERRTVITPDAG